MLRRLVAVVVAAVVAVVGWVAGAQPATAASTWWLPTAWTSTAVGTLSDVRSVMSGGTLAIGNAGGVVQGAAATSGGGNAPTYGWDHMAVYLDGGVLRWHKIACVPGTSNGGACGKGAAEGTAVNQTMWYWSLTCSTGNETRTGQVWNVVNGVPVVPSWCSTTGGHLTAASAGVYTGYANIGIDAFTWTMGSPDTYTTTITCRNLSTGVDTTSSESATGTAPSPVCPAGTVLVRVQVWQGSTLVQDSSITSAALSQYGGYLGDPSDWTWHNDGGSSCHIQSSSDPTMVITLSVDVCNEANGNGTTQSEQVQDCGSDIVCSAIQAGTSTIGRILTGIASGISSIAGTVKSIVTTVTQAASSIVQGIVDGLGGILERIITAIEAVKGAIEIGIAGILEKLGEIIGDLGGGTGDGGGGDGGGGGGTGPGNVSLPNPGDVTSKFTPWTDALRDLIEVFDRGDPGCAGPEFVVNLQAGGHTYPFGGHPFDACSEPMAGVASLVRSGLAIVFIVSGAAACIRILGSTFGVSGVGGGGGTEE